jgi:hypothetical protein
MGGWDQRCRGNGERFFEKGSEKFAWICPGKEAMTTSKWESASEGECCCEK